MTKPNSLYDQPDSFGWVSIAMHWLSAAVIIALWFLGKSIANQDVDAVDARRDLHVAVGLAAWLLLVARIVWRLIVRHPHARGQTQRIHRIARATHYLILLALGAMVVSGPLLAWWFPDRTAFVAAVHTVHASSATFLAVLVVVHILGSLKHLMFHDDETIARMFVPRKR